MRTRDDELLGLLAASLGPALDAEPSWAEISRLHRVLDTADANRQRRAKAPIWRLRRPATAALAGLFVLGGASAAAALSGAVMPEPVRVAARAVGLPVDSPGLSNTRAAIASLRDVLAHQPRDLNAIRARAQDVRDRLARLSADDRSRVDDEAAFLLAEADAAVAPPPGPLAAPSSSPASPSGASPDPRSPAAAPGGDDHGGRTRPSAEPEHSTSGADDHSGDDHAGSSMQTSGSGVSGPAPSGSSGDGDHSATTVTTATSGHDVDGGSSSDGGGSDGGGTSGSDGGGHSGPG